MNLSNRIKCIYLCSASLKGLMSQFQQNNSYGLNFNRTISYSVIQLGTLDYVLYTVNPVYRDHYWYRSWLLYTGGLCSKVN